MASCAARRALSASCFCARRRSPRPTTRSPISPRPPKRHRPNDRCRCCMRCSTRCMTESPSTPIRPTPPPRRPRPSRSSAASVRTSPTFSSLRRAASASRRAMSAGYFFRADGVIEQNAGHAWAEAMSTDLGWVGFDADQRHLGDRCHCGSRSGSTISAPRPSAARAMAAARSPRRAVRVDQAAATGVKVERTANVAARL